MELVRRHKLSARTYSALIFSKNKCWVKFRHTSYVSFGVSATCVVIENV